MRKLLISVYLFSAFIIFSSIAINAQTFNQIDPNGTCEGPVYKASELKQRASFISRPYAQLTEEARTNQVRGRVILKAVLCRSGRITDIEVIEGLPFGMTERAVEAVRKIKFTLAENAGQAVSQETKFEFKFSYLGDRRPLATGSLEGRMIESIEVTGHSESVSSEVGKCMNLLEGQVYNKELIERVWQMLLKLDDFDPKSSKIRIEEGETGGLGVVYLMQKRLKN